MKVNLSWGKGWMKTFVFGALLLLLSVANAKSAR